ncbi:MAG: tRNA epoxyqueuosine(34) reductase QueG [Planctomycetes bacterium]|nr:tRNA epoxyqueuosine(34) reductase QueG [Planctomycetota bacterium]
MGISPAGEVPSAEAAAALGRWVAEGLHGSLGWMARSMEKRRSTALVLPGVRSVVAVAVHYPAVGTGDVARYARGDDYHRVLGRRLAELAAFIRAEAGGEAVARWYVDTGPVLERDLAARSGLGWVGKNSMLIHPARGSWSLLGEVLTTVPLEPDAPVPDHCGSCTRCLEACPTGAIVAPHRLDARRCISYLTIEHRGPVPPEWREPLGLHLFGCDVCQEVCPFNGPGAAAGDPALGERPELPTPSLTGVLGLDRPRYLEAFRGSAMKRARLEGLRRNAALALGNAGDPRAVGPLARALAASAEAVVRGAAAWALGRLGGRAARFALERARRDDPDTEVRREAEEGLERSG